MENQLELFITPESQEKLEQRLRSELCNLIVEKGYHSMTESATATLIHLQKLLIEYFDNTRLLQNKPKEKVEL